jgi:Rrf2 family protein
MLQLTRQADYGLRLTLEVAAHGEGLVRTAEVARRQQISYQFLRKVAQILVSKGFLMSERGVGGGLTLARPAEEITVLDLVRVFGSPSLNRCTSDPPRCDRRALCAVYPVWAEAQNQVEQVLSGARLSDMVERQAALDRGRPEPELNVRPRSEEQEGRERDEAAAT